MKTFGGKSQGNLFVTLYLSEFDGILASLSLFSVDLFQNNASIASSTLVSMAPVSSTMAAIS